MISLPSAFTPVQKCGHSERSWYSICSRHHKHDPNCGMCNTGRCIECHPEFSFFDKKNNTQVHPFPNLKNKDGKPV